MTDVGRGIDEGGFGSLTMRGTGVRFTGVSLSFEVARRKFVLGVTGVFAYGDGSYAESGRKSRDSALARLTHRFLLLGTWSSGRLGHMVCFEGVGMDDGEDFGLGECKSEIDGLGNRLLPGNELDSVRFFGLELLLLVLILVNDVGVLDPKLPFLLPTMLLAGELPGVSTRLLANERSLDMTVDTESRRFLSRRSLFSSSMT